MTHQGNITKLDYYKMLEDFRKRDGHSLMLSSYAMGIVRGIVDMECTAAKKVTAIKKVVEALEKV
ncbi:hypothetical protein [Aneurinibacillus aneurinilyticus]|nr:hypothetical protein [Aneurinibacillus aneurinilyticus]MED0704790.1 hypothetical protein [Aneurinibacillus aneurinilyticus]MED0723344.1 hypothetical protein [Aneurinibacillus aneurinilyticus]MED0730438.1 hypothetical protein [Aneurinibacillus aneurinilyticus]MED0739170.1 hypothetical protein [Aneurinibacillus aneurinilyticus]